MVSEKDVLVAAAVFVLALISHSESMLLISIYQLYNCSVCSVYLHRYSLGVNNPNGSFCFCCDRSRWGYNWRQRGSTTLSTLHGLHTGARGGDHETRVRRLCDCRSVGDDRSPLPANRVRPSVLNPKWKYLHKCKFNVVHNCKTFVHIFSGGK